jgi:hypothetical protein
VVVELNEGAQWAVLVFLGTFVLGLTRQLGEFITANREDRAEIEGPALGRVAPDVLMTPQERDRISGHMHDRGVDWAGLIVTQERCPGCEVILSDLESGRAPRPDVLVMVSKSSGAEYRERLAKLADLVVSDEDRLERLDIAATPFCMVLDADFRVVQKAIGTHLHTLAARWHRRADGSHESTHALIDVAGGNGRD